MNTFRFLDFQVYKESKQFYKNIVIKTKTFPITYWELADQMRRSALSVCLNIAEGSAKRSDKDFNRFIENALGSINETVAGLDISYSENLLDKQTFYEQIAVGESITKQLGGFSRKLLSKKITS